MIDRLEMFVALASHRHFGRAGEALGVAQPTLSSAIKQLEDQLGVQLVRRGSRFHGLTPEGEHVRQRALSIVAQTRALRAEMRAVHGTLTGTLRIGVIPTALSMIAGLTAPYARRHPGVRIEIHSRNSGDILDQIAGAELDAGVTYTDPAPRPRLTTVPLYAERYCLLVARASAVAARAQVDWAEIAGLPLCLLTPDMQNRRIIDAHLAAAVARPPVAMVASNSTLALVGHVQTGDWVSVMPERLAAPFLGGGLVAVPIAGQAAAELQGQTVGLVVAAATPHTPMIEELLAQARRFAA